MILIFSPTLTPRLRYITKLIFCDILLSEVQFTDDAAAFVESDYPKLNYSDRQFNDEPFIKASEFLFSNSIKLPEIKPLPYKGEHGFFETSENSLMPFDPFASAFLMVSRIEEYCSGARDFHGRFCANSSLLFRFGLLQKPVVNIWANLLATNLQHIYPRLNFPKPSFRLLTTIDIDNAWAYRNKGFLRTLASLGRDIIKTDFKKAGDRFRVLVGKMEDPYDTYKYLDSALDNTSKNVIFFFHLGNYARYDKPVSWKNIQLKNLIQKIAGKYKIGIHPSYRSSDRDNKELVGFEKERLQEITGLKIERSRQHYLRLQFPETYRALITAGITEDYTMGFHDMAGFRAGICTPFKFYDLEKEQEESLTIFPFQVMDVTLRQYMKLSPEEAIVKMDSLINEIRKVGGTFIGIWHNESVSSANEWKDYLKVFEFMNLQRPENE
jgi:hypothetical protein